jgi:endoglucanase Acf2
VCCCKLLDVQASQDSKPNLLGEDLLGYSDDEEAPISEPAVSTQLGDTTSFSGTSRNSRESNRNSYGSIQSPTSSLGESDFDRSESDALNKHVRSMNRGTIDALKEGIHLTKEENRTLSFILLTVILTCAFSMAFLAGSMSESTSGPSVKGKNFPVQSNQDYFPFPDGSMFKAGGGLSAARETASYVPFETVDRRDDSIPASQIVFPDLFHSSLRFPSNFTKIDPQTNETVTPASSDFPLLKVPFPTGAFWTNLVIKPTADRNLSYPIMSYPYAFKWNPSMMQISYPPLRRLTDTISIRDIFNPDMTIGTEENIVKRNVVRFDPLSVTLRFYENQMDSEIEQHSEEADPASTYWESYLVQGTPYITMKINEMTPVLTPLSIFMNLSCPRDANGDYKDNASDPSTSSKNESSSNFFGICTNREIHERQVTLYGVQFLVRTQENLTWLIFASEPITLTLDMSKRSIRSEEKFTGILRLSLLPPPLEGNSVSNVGNQYTSFPLSESIGVKRLIYHAHSYPVGAKVSWDFKDVPASPSYRLFNNNDQNLVKSFGDMLKGVTVGTINFEYTVKTMHDNIHSRASSSLQDDPLLMLALPHHAQVLPSNSILPNFDLQYQCIKGPMTPIIGNTWSYDEHLTNIGFESEQDIRNIQNMDPETKQTILNQVELDLGRVLPTLTENVYGFGKQVARLAQLCRIASVLETPISEKEHDSDENDGTVYKTLTRKGTRLLHDALTKFLDGVNSDFLVYDINFGGIVSNDGLLNMNEDFGNGWYNDHHFHYGYVLYASAILGRLNSTFVDEYGTHVDSILYDVAHGANSDSDDRGGAFFPFARHKVCTAYYLHF